MKFFKTLSLVLFVSLAVISCKKDDEGGDGGDAGAGMMTAKVDGANFTSLDGTQAAEESNSGGVRVLAVSAGTVDSENLQMIVQNFDGVGTYDLNFLSIGTYSYLPDPSNPDPNTVVVYTTVNGTSSTGEINISEYSSTNVKGTFSFTGYNLNDNSDTVSVTEGSFDLELTQN
ncbi:MAG: hypothetical protein CMC74_11985 [Flavobacteriaceae bacterium]|nr:hypothetical protein [Flavobacteriaceae bacterium]|tara:strand:- start:70 stop:588 length:519 start_codon:yes stop_codon:yes gene_type:complete